MEYECPVKEDGKFCGKLAKCLINNTAVCRNHAKKFNIVIASQNR